MGFIKNTFAKLVGKMIGRRLGLKEDSEMNGSKKWWKSKNVWTGIITVLIGAYASVDASLAPQLGFDLPTIPEWLFVLLGAIGIYTRNIATKKIQ